MRFYTTLFFVFMFLSCKKEHKNLEDGLKDEEAINSNQAVETILLKKEDFFRKIVMTGKVEVVKKSSLNFKTSGRIASVKKRNGEKIYKGEVLARIENLLELNNLKKSKIELLKAENKLAEEKINRGEINVSKSVLKNLEVKSGVLEAKNNLEKVQIEYEQTLLKAPFSGVIANLEKKQGDFIASSDAFCTIINPSALEVAFSVLENEFGFISIGQEVEIEPFANWNQKVKGVVSEINPIVDENGLIKIKAKITSNNTDLLDGMHVKVSVNKPLKNVLTIPKEALVLRSNREVVFTYENGFAKWNYVEIAGENNNSYAIKKGLRITDTIIVSNNLNLSHDAKVKGKIKRI